MSAPDPKQATAAAKRDSTEELAERIFIGVAAQVYGNPAAGQQKPDPKAVAAMCFKLAEAFEQAIKETDRAKARIEAANKAAVKLDDVDLSSVFGPGKK